MVICVVTSRLSRWPNSFYSYYLSRPSRSVQGVRGSVELKDLPEAVESTVSVEHYYEMRLTFERYPLPTLPKLLDSREIVFSIFTQRQDARS